MLFLLLSLSTNAGAAIITVGPGGDYATIMDAVGAAFSGSNGCHGEYRKESRPLVRSCRF